jgi:hypothetical protein
MMSVLVAVGDARSSEISAGCVRRRRKYCPSVSKRLLFIERI